MNCEHCNKSFYGILFLTFASILILIFSVWVSSDYSYKKGQEDGSIITYINTTFKKYSIYPNVDINFDFGYNKILTFNEPISIDFAKGSGSMLPFLYANQTILEKEYLGEELTRGTIIIFKKGNKSIIHQIIDICENGYITKGFNNFNNDGCIQKNQIRFVVIGLIFDTPQTETYSGEIYED